MDLSTPAAAALREQMLALSVSPVLRSMIVLRDDLAAAMNADPGAMVFIVPQDELPGDLTRAFGSQVIHSAEVTQPMVALAVPRLA